MTKKTYGFTSSGKPIDDDMLDQFAKEAEKGFDDAQFDERPRGRGRPPLGDAAKVVGSLRLDPVLRKEVEDRANSEGINFSQLIRQALQKYLEDSPPTRSTSLPLIEELQVYVNELDVLKTAKRLTAIHRSTISEIDEKVTTLIRDYSSLLSRYSATFRNLSAEYRKNVERDVATVRNATLNEVDKIQRNYSIQVVRLRDLAEEVKTTLNHLDNLFRSKVDR